MNLRQVIAELDQRRGKRTWKELAAEIGCSTAYLSQVIREAVEPGPRILNYLGLEVEKRYVKSKVAEQVQP